MSNLLMLFPMSFHPFGLINRQFQISQELVINFPLLSLEPETRMTSLLPFIPIQQHKVMQSLRLQTDKQDHFPDNLTDRLQIAGQNTEDIGAIVIVHLLLLAGFWFLG